MPRFVVYATARVLAVDLALFACCLASEPYYRFSVIHDLWAVWLIPAAMIGGSVWALVGTQAIALLLVLTGGRVH